MATEPEVPLWTVTSQQESVDLASNGTYVQGTRITFRTRSGAMGSVFVAPGDYTPERVRALLQARAADMEAVHLMSGEG